MPEPFDEAFWNERYRSRPTLWSGEPNRYLVSEVADLRPGTALDVGSGEGADAIWLAGRGWRVTAVELAGVALERAAANAARAGQQVAERIEWQHADLTCWQPDVYDLVSVQYLHLPPAQRDPLFTRLAAAVLPGGHLLVVGHHPSDLQTTVGRPSRPELLYTAEDLVASLDPLVWDIVTAATPGRDATDSEGRTVTVHDTVLRARRKLRAAQQPRVDFIKWKAGGAV